MHKTTQMMNRLNWRLVTGPAEAGVLVNSFLAGGAVLTGVRLTLGYVDFTERAHESSATAVALIAVIQNTSFYTLAVWF